MEQQENAHPIFDKDPADYLQNVYKEVCIEVKDGTKHTGRLYTIDPVSESLILVSFDDKSGQRIRDLQLIMGHAVVGLSVLDDNVDMYKEKMDTLFKTNMHPVPITCEEMDKCKEHLKAWLLQNRLPVEESKDAPQVLRLSDALSIYPPYGPNDCQSTNEIILGKVQTLIKSMPKD